MTEPLDVSLRVRLAYEGGAVKTAVADLEGVRAAATKLAAASGGAARLAADMDAIARPAAGRGRDSQGRQARELRRAAGGATARRRGRRRMSKSDASADLFRSLDISLLASEPRSKVEAVRK